MQGDNIRVNGNGHCWGSITIKIDGDILRGFFEINYGQKRERAKGYGTGAHQAPQRRSKGQYNPEVVKLIGYSASVEALTDKLAQAYDGVSYGDTEFPITIQAVEQDEKPLNVEIKRCVVAGVSAAHKAGADLLVRELEIDVMAIVENGKTLFDSTTDPTPV